MNWTTMRADVRGLLNDPPGGIYSDDQITAAATAGYNRAMQRNAKLKAFAVAVLEGDDTVGLPFPVVSIRSARNGTWPMAQGTAADMIHPRHTDAQLMYVLVDPLTLQLSRPTNADEAGTWTILASRIPALPTAPGDAWESPDHINGAIARFAAADLIRTRIADSVRRGHKPDFTANQLAVTFEREAREMIAPSREARTT